MNDLSRKGFLAALGGAGVSGLFHRHNLEHEDTGLMIGYKVKT